MTRFACGDCGAILTARVVRLENAERLDTEHGEPYLPRGRFVIADGRYWADRYGDDFIVHPDDLVGGSIEGDWDDGRSDHYGCCGLDGGEGRNTVCRNGHLVATELSECGLPRCAFLDSESVTPVDGEDSSP